MFVVFCNYEELYENSEYHGFVDIMECESADDPKWTEFLGKFDTKLKYDSDLNGVAGKLYYMVTHDNRRIWVITLEVDAVLWKVYRHDGSFRVSKEFLENANFAVKVTSETSETELTESVSAENEITEATIKLSGDNWRSRKVLALLYPDNPAHVKAVELIETTPGYEYLIVLHDKDTYSEAEAEERGDKTLAGKPKKPHWHLYLSFGNARYVNALAKELGVDARFLSKVATERSAVRYLVHADQPEKAQYDLEDVTGTLLPLLAKMCQADADEGVRAIKLLDTLESIDSRVSVSAAMRIAANLGMYADFRRAAVLYCKVLDEHNSKYGGDS